ncbi:MAG: ABC transporter ATP-binding protein/permease [Clostridia bacterium]|nr:ABC transporter ATP-binding protein/permease [Clostridia bacterium]
MIELKQVNKYYNRRRGNEIQAVKDTTLTLPDTGMVAVFGKSGCGKTTLLNVIGGLDGYDSGEVLVNGQKMSPKEDLVRNRDIGYIFQNYNLNEEQTVFENVADSLYLCGMTGEEAVRERVNRALAAVGMEKYGRRLPGTLSGGQQQRVAIARAIVKGARVILADEPTGNLDDENTLMVMNLLRAISEDHLVLLVTHEMDLVDYYCSLVIEVVDGRVERVRENTLTDGIHRNNQHDIFLGDLHKRELGGDGLKLSYYGEQETPPADLSFRLVQVGNTIFLDTGNDARIKLLTSESEVTLKEGTFEQEAERMRKSAQERSRELASFEEIRGRSYGKLYHWKNAMVESARSIFRRKKHGRFFMFSLLILFAGIIVLMSALSGVSLRNYIRLRQSYNHHVVFAEIRNQEDVDRIRALIKDQGDNVHYNCLSHGTFSSLTSLSFSVPSMETFRPSGYYGGDLSAEGMFIDHSLCRDLKLLAGTKELENERDIVLSSNLADRILEGSPYDFISSYEDLLYLTANRGTEVRIVGVVETEENNYYVSPVLMTYLCNLSYSGISAGLVSMDTHTKDLEEPAPGQVYIHASLKASHPQYAEGATLTLSGNTYRIARVLGSESGAEADGAYRAMAAERFPFESFCPSSQSGNDFAEAYAEQLYDNVYLYRGTDSFATYLDFLVQCREENSFLTYEEYCLSEEAFSDEALYFHFTEGNPDLFFAALYMEGLDYDLSQASMSDFEDFRANSEDVLKDAGTEYYTTLESSWLKDSYSYEQKEQNDGYAYRIYMNRADYEALAQSWGPTDEGLSYSWNDNGMNMLIHAGNVKAIEKEMQERGIRYTGPEDYFEAVFADEGPAIIGEAVVFLVVLAILSLCIFFVMRSSLMVRIREVGINRAIGVSRRNVVFRFFVESLILTGVTVLLGFLAASLFIGRLAGVPILSERLFYPVWLAAAVGGLLLCISLFCGTLPVRNLLHRTPSEILSKYDI